jgi:hypothetical protein
MLNRKRLGIYDIVRALVENVNQFCFCLRNDSMSKDSVFMEQAIAMVNTVEGFTKTTDVDNSFLV